jgi:hypothetical protein
MKALSIRQPWCHHILVDGKDVENRDWATRFRGEVLIHAGKAFDGPIRDYPEFAHLPRGGIVGVVEIVDCVSACGSEWFCGDYGFVLRNARVLPFIPCRGALGFFDVPPDVERAVLAALGRAS